MINEPGKYGNANGITIVNPPCDEDPYCKNCFAEFGMNGWNNSTRHKSCLFQFQSKGNEIHKHTGKFQAYFIQMSTLQLWSFFTKFRKYLERKWDLRGLMTLH